MANRKPIRWDVPLGGESYMGLAQYFLAHEENMRQAFSQPSRRARRTLPDGTTIDYIMNDVVDFISISTPQRIQRAVGKSMTWDRLPPLEEGTSTIDLSQMTEDPDVSGGHYCTVSVINGTDENGRLLPAEFSIEASHTGWSIYQGIRQSDGTYKSDGVNATLRLYEPLLDGTCDIIANDGRTTLKMTVSAFKPHFYYRGEDGLYYTVNSTTGELDYFTAGKSSEEVSVNPFTLFGQQYLKREDVVSYVCTYRHIVSYTVSLYSATFLYEVGGHIKYDVVTKFEWREAWLVVAGTGIDRDTTEVTYDIQPIPMWDYELEAHGYPYTITIIDDTSDEYTTDITIVGSSVLPSFLVMQQPMSDGDGVTTIAMKKPGEEVYFVVCYHDNSPTSKTVHWFINSTSYASYAFSEDLKIGDVNLLLDNVYYGQGV